MQTTLSDRSQPMQAQSWPLLLARFAAVLSLAAVPLSTAGVNLGSGLVLLFAACSPEAWRGLRKIRTSPTSVAAIVLFALLGLSLLYTKASMNEAINFLLKYRKLLMFPLLLLVLRGEDSAKWGSAAIWALFAALTLTMFLTYTNAFGWTAVGPMHDTQGPMSKPWVFKDHISGGLMMAFLMWLSIALGQSKTKPVWRALLYANALLALVNVLFVLQGRTGQVVALVYIAVFVVWQLVHLRSARAGRIRLVATLACVVACMGIAYYAFTAKDSRLADTSQEITSFENSNQVTSAGVRLEFYRRSVDLFAHRPIAGYGVGSVLPEFERFAKNQTGGRAVMAGNPHNEFLLMGVQLGVIGIALFMWLLVALYRECRHVDPLARNVIYGYLLAFFVGCLANSLLLNFTEGSLFVLLSGILLYSRRVNKTAQPR
ncbi:O-antigen ligase family protein [Paraburkholderia sp. CNPSo 3272]|uniref:O-antigen ligase family protein n=1 Tax=Paraburkholderia sp. CNPSo 3272 TaxID=2940931 RepID=UPI0020B7D1DE|nr:O-antigen ligase family protein [Paraburkholderia sp. CNPSo 3272]MCP3726888.1 O-antigen ligase family protein [Paraburkholderia sp. CNPSo 3272]